MKTLARSLLVVVAALAAALPSATAQRFVSGQAASVVLGQPDFTSTDPVPVTPGRFGQPAGVAVDPATGKVFVAEFNNNRVLRFSSAAAAQIGAFAEAVFGQPSFGSRVANWSGGPDRDTLDSPIGIHVDAQGRLWVADRDNHRVLMFEGASLVGPTRPFADRVFGQPDFTTDTSGTTATTMNEPYGVDLGPDDTLWVAEFTNRRVLRFDNVSGKASGSPADGVLGQPNFTTDSAAVTAAKMSAASGVDADSAGRLWVTDAGANRVLRFDAAKDKPDGSNADAVIGQPNFTTALAGLSATALDTPLSTHLDASGALWVADFLNGRALRFPAAAGIAAGGTADLVLGKPTFTTSLPGPISAAFTGQVSGIATGPGGSVFVADLTANRVLRFDLIPKATFTARAAKTTRAAAIVVNGTVANASAVQVKVGKAPFRAAKITGPRWTFRTKLKPGRNVLTVRALGPGGDAAPKKLLINRR